MMHDHGWSSGGDFGLAGGIIMAAVWVAVIVGVIVMVVWLLRQVQTSGQATAGQTGTAFQTPLDILKTRYAKGEIEKDEYEERRKTLME